MSGVSRGDSVPSVFLVSIAGAAGLEDRNDTAATVADILPDVHELSGNAQDAVAQLVSHSIFLLSFST
jgi:hypothetical protein